MSPALRMRFAVATLFALLGIGLVVLAGCDLLQLPPWLVWSVFVILVTPLLALYRVGKVMLDGIAKIMRRQ